MPGLWPSRARGAGFRREDLLIQALSDVSATSIAPEMWGVAGVVFGALLGGAAQIVTVILTHRHAVQREHIQFRRDAYLETLRRAEGLVQATQNTFLHATVGQEGFDYDAYMEWLGREGGALRAFMDSQLALEMYAPPPVTAAVQRLLDAVQLTRNEPEWLLPSAAAAMLAYGKAHDEAVAAMRLDLWVDRRGLWRRTVDRVLGRPPAGHGVELRLPGAPSIK